MLGAKLSSDDDREALIYTQQWLRDPDQELPWLHEDGLMEICLAKSMFIDEMRENATALEQILLSMDT